MRGCKSPTIIFDTESTVTQLQEWLQGDNARQKATAWLNRLSSKADAIELIREFTAALSDFERVQHSDWNDLASLLDEIYQELDLVGRNRSKRKPLENRRDRIEAELKKIANRRLHDELVKAAILPIYGFPIDVVRLLTGESNEFKSSQGKHRLERDRRMALGEYAPGQEIVVDNRVFSSVGILRPQELEQKYYWVCKQVSSLADDSETTSGLDFWRSLTYALLAAASEVIDVPRTELDGLFRPLDNQLAEIIIYDNVPDGAGYSRRIADKFNRILETAILFISQV